VYYELGIRGKGEYHVCHPGRTEGRREEEREKEENALWPFMAIKEKKRETTNNNLLLLTIRDLVGKGWGGRRKKERGTKRVDLSKTALIGI